VPVFGRTVRLTHLLIYSPTVKSPNVMETFDHRENRRIRRNFPVKLLMKGTDNISIEGMTIKLRQGGALIKLNSRLSFQAHPQAVLTFFLPPDFTGQNKTIVLQGDAVITGIDQENKRMEIEFIKTFRELERIDPPDLYEHSDNRIAF
jgi:hypothetical protein